MADNQNLHLRTDLHTHLAAILPAETLISLAKSHGINESDIKEPLDIKETTTFDQMSLIYRNRNAIIRQLIKNGYGTELFQEIANEYHNNGIEYAEITTDEDILKKIVDGTIDIDSAEKMYGVSLRFLLQIHRDRDASTNINSFFSESIQEVMTNVKYIKGVDICGQEATSSKMENQQAFLEALIYYINRQSESNRDFMIRIHSGETTNDKSGIVDSLMIIKEYCQKTDSRYPWIRFGHAFHGINESVIKLMQTMGVSVDLNLSSNLRLNNLNQVELLNDRELANAIELCQKYGVPIFLGTDGHGLYHSSSREQLELAKDIGIDIKDVISNEKEYLNVFNDKAKDPKKRNIVTAKNIDKYNTSRRAQTMGAEDIAPGNRRHVVFAQKYPISILGSGYRTRSNITVKEYEKAYSAFNALLYVLDPQKVFFVTSGVSLGSERFLHDAVSDFNSQKSKEDKYSCLGVIPRFVGKANKTARIDYSKLKDDTITHSLVLDVKNQWGEYPSKFMKTIYEGDVTTKGRGFTIFVGGGQTLKDIINLSLSGDSGNTIKPVECWMFTGTDQDLASKEMFKANQSNPHAHGFDDAETLIKSLYEYCSRPDSGLSPNQIFKDDFDIEKVGEYISKAKENTPYLFQIIADTIVSEGLFTKKQLNGFSAAMIAYQDPEGYDGYIDSICEMYPDKSDILEVYLGHVKKFIMDRKASKIPDSEYDKMVTIYDPTAFAQLEEVRKNMDNDRGLS